MVKRLFCDDKAILFLIAFFLSVFTGYAQHVIFGVVEDASSGDPLVGATVHSLDKDYATVTDQKGHFLIEDLPLGRYDLIFRFLGFADQVFQCVVKTDERLYIRMEKKSTWMDQVVVRATRASKKNPIAFTNIRAETLKKQNIGQDTPFILRWTPSLTATSDGGAGVGYTGLRIRGSDATRVNVMVNGIPFNDSESQGVFWVNMPDIVASTESIQIQRGLGTSVNGSGSFGASINLNTLKKNETPYCNISTSFGSFNTFRHSVSFGANPIDKRFSLVGRTSLIGSDGFIDRASSDLKSLYLAASYRHKNTSIDVVAMLGKEITYQSWHGVPESKLNNDIPAMNKTAQAEEWNDEQKNNLLNANRRTFNVYMYDNQVDDYEQNHYQVHFSHQFASVLTANLSWHYTYGKGFFEEFKDDQKLTDYGLSDQSGVRADLVRRKWLENHFYGLTYSVHYKKNNYKGIVGGGWNNYKGDHFGDVIRLYLSSVPTPRFRYYFNQGDKYDFTIFWKSDYQFIDSLNVFFDFQYRRVVYNALGKAARLQDAYINETYHFFNPKMGITYSFSRYGDVYVSYGVATKEPIRSDFLSPPSETYPRPETLYDLEVGVRYVKNHYTFGANVYWMNYTNQLILTGTLNDVGAPVRTNVDKSYRLGLELEGSFTWKNKITFTLNTSLSLNKINRFVDVLYDYGADFTKQIKIETPMHNVDISFSPTVVAGSLISYRPISTLELSLGTKYVSEQYLDNTSNAERKLDDYLVNDLRIAYSYKFADSKQITLRVAVNNIFNEEYASNGYTYGYRAGVETIRQNYFYPQAGIHYTVMLAVKM